MNRPQFAFATPPGYYDVPFVRPVTNGQDPTLLIPSGEYLNNFIIQMDNDAPQVIRSLFCEGVQQAQLASLQMQLRDAFGVFLTDGYVPLWLLCWGAGSTPPDGGSGRTKVFESELYCPPGSVLIADFFNPGSNAGIIPSFSSPSHMSPSHTAVQMESHAVGGQGQGAGVISFGAALYQVLQFVGLPFPGGEGSINVYRSLNGGLTWSILDGANSPTKHVTFPEPQAGVYFDGVSTITVAATLGSVLAASAQPIYLQDFDLLTGTWGAVYGAGSSNVYGINQVYKRSDGSLLVIAVDGLSGGVAVSLGAYVLSGGSWSSFSLTAGLPGGWVDNVMSSTVYEPATGTIHMFGIAFVSSVKKQFYQQILLSNSVSGFQDLTGLYLAATAMGDPVILAGKLLWGVVDAANTFSTLLVGAPLSAPVFNVVAAPGVNPSQPIPYGANPNTLQPTLATDGQNLWAVVVDNRNFAGLARIWLSVTQDIADPSRGWVGTVIYDDATAPFPLSGTFQYPTISLSGDRIFVTFQNSTGQPDNYFLDGTLSGVYPPTMEFRGVKRWELQKCQ